MRAIFFILLFVFGFSAHSQTITTIAGHYGIATVVDSGAATAGALRNPLGIALDHFGNVFIVESGANRVKKITPSGMILPYAGSGVATTTSCPPVTDSVPALSFNVCMASDVVIFNDMMYLCDRYVIRTINMSSPEHIISNYAGGWSSSACSGDGGPATAAGILTDAIATDTKGNIYTACLDYYTRRIDAATHTIHAFGGIYGGTYSGDGGPATNAGIGPPSSIVVAEDGSVMIAHGVSTFSYLRRVDTAGIIHTVAGNGVYGYSGDGGPATAAAITVVNGMAFDGAGNLLFCDRDNHRIRKIDGAGIITTVAGTGGGLYSGDGGPATAAQIGNPYDLAIDDTGNIYFTDPGSRVVRKVSSGNHIPVVAGDMAHVNEVCAGSVLDLGSITGVTDADAGQVLTWQVLHGPVHGVLSGFSTTVTAGSGVATPVGVSYTPAAGYSGPDSFRVKVHDGTSAVRFTVYISVPAPAHAGVISGADSLCPGDSVLFADTAAGGVWSSSNTAVASVNGSGMVYGLGAGSTTISYTVAGVCDTAVATYTVGVRTASGCISNVNAPADMRGVHVYPMPSAGMVRVKVPGTGSATQVSIYDATGRCLQQQSGSGIGEALYTFNDLPAGSHVIKVSAGALTYRMLLVVVK